MAAGSAWVENRLLRLRRLRSMSPRNTAELVVAYSDGVGVLRHAALREHGTSAARFL